MYQGCKFQDEIQDDAEVQRIFKDKRIFKIRISKATTSVSMPLLLVSALSESMQVQRTDHKLS